MGASIESMYSESDFRPRVGTSAPYKDQSGWVSARRALKLMQGVKGVYSPDYALLERAIAGDVRAWTFRMVVGATSWADVQIPPLFWQAIGGRDQGMDWATGTFQRQLSEGFLILAYSVRFNRGDIEGLPRKAPLRGPRRREPEPSVAIAEPASTPTSAPPSAGKTGGRSMAASWPDWVAELVSYIHEHGIPDGEGVAGVDVMLRAVADGLALRGIEGPSRTTAQKTMRAVLLRLRAAGN